MSINKKERSLYNFKKLKIKDMSIIILNLKKIITIENYEYNE